MICIDVLSNLGNAANDNTVGYRERAAANTQEFWRELFAS
jgi:flagellar basal body rod protein FlgG